jgi:sec-independent protein translocase protein TatB
MFGIGTGEILLIAFIALLVLGPERMPQLMRDVGKAMSDLRKTSDELQQEFLNADRKISAEKVLDAATRMTASDAPETAKVAEIPATTQAEVPTTQAEVVTPTEPAPPEPAPLEPDETAFDREARLARERIDRLG